MKALVRSTISVLGLALPAGAALDGLAGGEVARAMIRGGEPIAGLPMSILWLALIVAATMLTLRLWAPTASAALARAMAARPCAGCDACGGRATQA